MRGTYKNLILLLALLALLAGCDNGSMSHQHHDTAAKVSAVPVTLTLGGNAQNLVQKSVALTGADVSYWFKATPMWGDTSARGADLDFRCLTDFINGQDGNLGYFNPGTWKFEVQIRDAAGVAVFFTGAADSVQIGTAKVSVTVDMVMNDGEISSPETGSTLETKVEIKVAVPKLEHTAFIITHNGTQLAGVVPVSDKSVDTEGEESDNPGSVLYTKTIDAGLAPGTSHEFVFTYFNDAR